MLSEHVIDAALADIRAIEDRAGITPASLGEMQARLTQLVKSQALSALTPPRAADRSIYYVLRERDRYGLYLNVAPAGGRAPPHCHGVWCVAAGFRGEELNRFYRRVGHSPGRAPPRSRRGAGAARHGHVHAAGSDPCSRDLGRGAGCARASLCRPIRRVSRARALQPGKRNLLPGACAQAGRCMDVSTARHAQAANTGGRSAV
jgi:predicted metal-dependent enzyme (double-stranded beta helix superfamily)